MEDRKYIPITWGDVGRFFSSLFAVGLAVLNFHLIVQSWKLLGLGNLGKEQSYSFGQLAICCVLIGEYLLISASAICLAALVKKGFKNLKPIKEYGLIFGLIFGLIVGLVGLIAGLVGLIAGLIFGLILGLIFGLIAGLIFGLKNEFAETPSP